MRSKQLRSTLSRFASLACIVLVAPTLCTTVYAQEQRPKEPHSQPRSQGQSPQQHSQGQPPQQHTEAQPSPQQHPQEQPAQQRSEAQPSPQQHPQGQPSPQRSESQRPSEQQQGRSVRGEAGQTRATPPATSRQQRAQPEGAALRQDPGGNKVRRPGPGRALPPRYAVHGHTGWSRWNHPAFVRPVYRWNWGQVQTVTCVAQDSNGNQYPVIEPTYSRFDLARMSDVEDDALDRCYTESGQDPMCALAGCSHD